MLHRLILKVAKFQLHPPKRLGTVVKNILGAIMPPTCQIGLIYFNKSYCLEITFDGIQNRIKHEDRSILK